MKHIPTARLKGYLPVTGGHKIFWQEYGKPNGTPLLFLHGGPGCGFDPGYLKLFDLRKVRLITFDQRGCGQSRPIGRFLNNTTSDLVGDIEALRRFLNVEEWFVCGHSWGTTLAIVYAAENIKAVRGLMLAGLFSGTRQDHLWCFEAGKRYFPESYESLRQALGRCPSDDKELLQDMVTGTLQRKRVIARALSTYFLRLISFKALPIKGGAVSKREIALWSIFFSFASNDFFLGKKGIYPYARKLRNLPISLVHGRYDMDCAPAQAYRLKKMLPHLRLVVPNGNHDVEEEPMASAFRKELEFLVS